MSYLEVTLCLRVCYLLQYIFHLIFIIICFLCGSVGKESAYSAGDPGLIPGSRRSSGEGNGNPLQYSYLENPMDRGAWQATDRGVTKSWARLGD